MKKPRVLIDVNSIISYIRDGALSGIGRTTFELLRQWDSLMDEMPLKLFYIPKIQRGLPPKVFLGSTLFISFGQTDSNGRSFCIL